MLVELAVGDAYGAGREFADPQLVEATNDGVTYLQHPLHKGLRPGRYTDDTQMSIGLSEFLLAKQPTTYVMLARYFVWAFKRDPRVGYSQRFYEFLVKVKNGTDFVQNLVPVSDKSGGAMRAAPCGLMSTIEEAVDLATWQAALTHASRDGLAAAQAAAALVWACRHGCDTGYLGAFLCDVVPGHGWDTPWEGPVSSAGLPVVKAALAAVMDNTSMLAALKQSIAYTGDVDTVGALAMAAASVHPAYQQDLPQVLYDGLEKGEYGRKYLEHLDEALMQRFPLVSEESSEKAP
jgi:ADP-ribosylglycohydrolase